MIYHNDLIYGTRQSFGRLLQQWMEGSTADNCPVLPATLRLKDLLKSRDLEVDLELHPYLPVQIEDHFNELETSGPRGGAWDKICIQEIDPQRDPEKPGIHMWEGQVAPGILMIEEIKRTHGPYTSEISHAVYTHYFPIETLRYIYLLDICNKDTKDFVTKELYSKPNGLHWPDETIREWEDGTPEFEALLGTQLGRTVGYMLLGAFPRGARRIARIRTYYAYEALQMRFEVEDVVPTVMVRRTTGFPRFPMRTFRSAPKIARSGWKGRFGPETRSASRRRINMEEEKEMTILYEQQRLSGIRKR
ncbi:hypothetical protein N7457_007073 [Penicillium paradoxum]|uniref:uncharacterized protein n=1 Tax=Penicillium paradoxum TaxID=176176 RepID=UPI002546E264|nr:uncharacterized protein N7457_007073 [Penicillium paradoxum]KAJ5779353.1 hypothetical protein N7457_007073 [Penicillium paradoxum]